MPITPKSHDFIEGYIFSEVESTLIRAFVDTEARWNKTVVIPKSWFGLRAAQNFVMLTEHEQSKLRVEIKDILCQMNHDTRSYEYTVIFRPYKQYIHIDIEGVYVEPPVKEMTIEQIEKELGYKIKVVSYN